MNFSDNHKTCWVTPMRTATRSCIKIQNFFEFDRVGQHDIINYEDKKDYDIIFNIRSPYPRIVSLFKIFCFHNTDYNIDFNLWLRKVVDDFHRNNHFYYTIHLDHIMKKIHKRPTYLIKVEFLEEDLKKIPIIQNNLLSLSEIFENQIRRNGYFDEFGKFSEKMSIPWQSYYNQESADLVFKTTENQFNIFNYNRNYWKDGTP
jgi:hypothetical protein